MSWFLYSSTILMLFASVSSDCILPEEVRAIQGIAPVEDKESYGLWESVLFLCSEGYEPLLEEFVSFCTDEEVFDPDPMIFSCSTTCSPPIVEEDTSFSLVGGEDGGDAYDGYQIIEFSCSDEVEVGYLEGGVQPFLYCSNGEWEPSVYPDCKVSCPVPVLQNDTVYGSPVPQDDAGYVRHGTSITYECVDGIPGGTLEGPMETICNDGQFTDQTIPDCKVSCESPQGLAPSGITEHGVTVNFTCESGGLIQDGIDVLCDDGEWSKNPVCSLLCPGRDGYYYTPLDTMASTSRKRRSSDTNILAGTRLSDIQLTAVTAGLVGMVTTTTAVGFVTVVWKIGDQLFEIFE